MGRLIYSLLNGAPRLLRSGSRRYVHSGKKLSKSAAVASAIETSPGVKAKRDAVPALSGTKLDPSESFMTGANAFVLEEMYEKYLEDPRKVGPSWIEFFDKVEKGIPPGQATTLSRKTRNQVSMVPHTMTAGQDLFQIAEETVKLMSLIRAYRHRGHFVADLDPLRLDADIQSDTMYSVPHNTRVELQPSHYGFTEADLDREFVVSTELPGPAVRKLRDIVGTLRRAYCGKVGIEYRHMLSKQEKDWIASQVETPFVHEFSRDEKLQMLSDLQDCELFETFLAYKHSTAKRFGLEGGETVVPGLQAMMLHASNLGVENTVIGMAHRGRLNILARLVQKPIVQILYEFRPHTDPDLEEYLGSGDVKYHVGASSRVKLANGQKMTYSLLANPSHLEAVDPVVVGKTRAKQFDSGDKERRRTIGLLIHGDASFAGQGVVAETLELSDLRDYTTGGTVHVIVNNQVGFTTDPRAARSSPYPTDVAKTVGVPIFHVNGDDVEAVVRTCKMAVEYRQRFRKDVVVDIFCYRRHGHNELDQPMFTQPLMYKKIKTHPTPMKIYEDRLISEGVTTAEAVEKMHSEKLNFLTAAFNRAENYKPKGGDFLDQKWARIKSEKEHSKPQLTGVSEELLYKIGNAYTKVPPGLHVHPLLKRILSERREAIELGSGIDWANAEALAFASLLVQGYNVRLSGQDCERGTFSQRHMVWHDQDNGAVYNPLNNLGIKQKRFQIANSNLSEMAVLGFEQGYCLENPDALVCWEAQFGDFANGAQVIIDTFIAAGERKWRRQSGIVLLLPHGYEGQGPEHSSGRIERYLQMCDDDPDVYPSYPEKLGKQIQESNMQIVNPTTPSNYFHVLRRQVCREFRKPLIAFTPKSLLRHPQCKSNIKDFAEGTKFENIIDDPYKEIAKGKNVKRLAFCSGKVYYDLVKERSIRKQNDIRFIRMEQIAPFPYDLVKHKLLEYPKAETVWIQEESKNMGSWSYVAPRFDTTMRHTKDKRKITYIGRPPSAAPATGNAKKHSEEVVALMNDSFTY